MGAGDGFDPEDWKDEIYYVDDWQPEEPTGTTVQSTTSSGARGKRIKREKNTGAKRGFVFRYYDAKINALLGKEG